MFSNAVGNTAYSQEHLNTILYAIFGGQTKCVMGHSIIENCSQGNDNNPCQQRNLALGLRETGRLLFAIKA